MKKLLFSFLLSIVSFSSLASSTTPVKPSAEDQTCALRASHHYGVDFYLLLSIAWVESRYQLNAMNKNKNGSYDMSVMQINSFWLPHLKPYGITQKSLMSNRCLGYYIGAWILAQNIQQYGYTWKAIGAYNSRTPSIALNYAKKVYQAHYQLTGVPNQANHISSSFNDNTPLDPKFIEQFRQFMSSVSNNQTTD